MRRLLLVLALALLALAASAASAAAASRVWSKTVPMPEVGGYAVKQGLAVAPHPEVDGHITAMRVNIVDRQGRAVPIRRLMLHHIVFVNLDRPDVTCANRPLVDWDSHPAKFATPERFYAAGEERSVLSLPPGHGYALDKDDTWFVNYMVMNHRSLPDRAYIKYTVRYETEKPFTPVTPYWLDEENCQADPVYNVPGGARRGATDRRTYDFRAPRAGRIVAGGGHVHGGAKDLALSRPDCSKRPFARSRPTWGGKTHPFYRVKPVLHEPGPVNMTAFWSPGGVPLAQGERVRLTSRYDAHEPHVRVMGIAVVYVAPAAAETPRCAPAARVLSTPRRKGRYVSPRYPIPIYALDVDGQARRISRPPGRLVKLRSGATVPVRYYQFARRNVSVKRGARIRWKFFDAGHEGLHNVTLANGPQAIGTPNLNDGRTASFRFRRKGTYRLFCGLHPVLMTQRVVVR